MEAEMAITPLKAIRKYCLDCCDGSHKAVKYCTCDGINSTRCILWPYRFGLRPVTAAKRHGPELLNSRLMPPADVMLEECGAPKDNEPTRQQAAGARETAP